MPRSTISGRASSSMRSPRSWSDTKVRYAAVVTWNPPGTEKARPRHARKRSSLAADDLEAVVFRVEGCREIYHL